MISLIHKLSRIKFQRVPSKMSFYAKIKQIRTQISGKNTNLKFDFHFVVLKRQNVKLECPCETRRSELQKSPVFELNN
jgi:hypothetical protein